MLENSVLVKMAQKGDKEALLSLILPKKDELYRLAYVYTHNEQDAQDALEDMILIIYEKIHKLKKLESFYSWSKTILVNCCKDICRKKKRVVLVNNLEDEKLVRVNKYREERIDIYRCLATLSDKQSEAIKLRYFLDYDYKTIVLITNVSEGTVKSRIFEGLRKLKKCMGGEYFE